MSVFMASDYMTLGTMPLFRGIDCRYHAGRCAQPAGKKWPVIGQ